MACCERHRLAAGTQSTRPGSREPRQTPSLTRSREVLCASSRRFRSLIMNEFFRASTSAFFISRLRKYSSRTSRCAPAGVVERGVGRRRGEREEKGWGSAGCGWVSGGDGCSPTILCCRHRTRGWRPYSLSTRATRGDVERDRSLSARATRGDVLRARGDVERLAPETAAMLSREVVAVRARGAVRALAGVERRSTRVKAASSVVVLRPPPPASPAGSPCDVGRQVRGLESRETPARAARGDPALFVLSMRSIEV